MMQRLMYLTNTSNGYPEEDQVLASCLAEYFDVVTRHPLECLESLNGCDGIVIRNIWPTHEYQAEWEPIKEQLRDLNVPTYNPLTKRGDIEGKDYLLDLYRLGYPVIPSVNSAQNVHSLSAVGDFWVKPKKSCDGFGARRLNLEQLLREHPTGQIIQPFMQFTMEPSFFFIDGEFHHAIAAKHRLLDDRVIPYQATIEDLSFARSFIEWSDMPFGIQRIDAIRLHNGQLLLTEIENFCPYLYLLDIDKELRKSFVDNIIRSISTTFDELAPSLEFSRFRY